VKPNDAGQGQLTIVVAPPANHPLVSISVSPSSANILSAGTQQFTATVSNASNTMVAWSASSGTITADGLYTAPVVNSDTSVTITGTSLADSSKQMSVAIAVKSQSNKLPVSISLSPGKATVSSGGAQQFTANVSNTANTAASWWASAGKISSSGLLTAPVVETNTSIQVTVTSLADSSKQATATVTVNPVVAPPSIQISGTISPAANGSGATVILSGASGATTRADASGNYTFSGLANGSYVVTPAKTGFSFTPSSQAATAQGVNVTSLDFSATSSTKTLLGVVGPLGDFSSVQVMENWQGKKFAVIQIFSNLCPGNTKQMDTLFKIQLLNIWKNGNVPVLTWQPYLCNASNTPTDIDNRVATGDYDPYLNQFADGLKSFLSGPDGVFGTADDRRLYFRFAHEMNGDWYPWSANSSGQTPLNYIGMWQHVHNIFEAKGIDSSHVQWVWCVNSKDFGRGYTAEQYYPGDAYVDWMGIDGYNFGNRTFSTSVSVWQTPDEVISPMLTRVHALASKPLGLMETGSSAMTSSGINLSAKDQWIQELYTYVQQHQFGMVIWFNHDTLRPEDWSLFGGSLGDQTFTSGTVTYNFYSAYKPAIGVAGLISSDSSSPHLLSDTLFMGQ